MPGTVTDVVVGALLPEDSYHATILQVFESNRSLVQLPGARGLGSFKSMAFSEDGLSLFAVDEQPALWRWTRMSYQTWWKLSAVANYIHPSANSVWKVMVWSNARIVVGVEYSLNLWTQCSPCPAGTVTTPGEAVGDIRKRCLCRNGTFNDLVDFRR